MISFNRSQRLGLNLDQHIALDAGAGTGKTTVMAERYVQHLLSAEQRATYVLPPPIRQEPFGSGKVLAAKRDRTPMNEWRGLLPQEIVAITFTRKAASELRSRIRQRIQSLRANPVKEDDRMGVHDPRLRHQGDVSMLMSLLEAAPISTIDAFLSEILAPHIDLVAIHLSREQLAEEKTPLLRSQALNAAWRIRNARDAIEAGMLQSADEFIGARNRLAIRLGGQQSAQTVLEGLLESSLFVEESRRRLRSRSIRTGLPWDGNNPPDYRLIEDMVLQECQHLIDPVVGEVHAILNEWVDVFLEYHSIFVAPAQTETTSTRFNQLAHLAREPLPETAIERLQWLYQVVSSATSFAQLNEITPTILKGGNFPRANTLAGWPAGLMKWSSVLKGKDDKTLKARIISDASSAAERLQNRLHDPTDGRLVLMLAKVAYSLNPSQPFIHRDGNERYDSQPLGLELSQEPPQTNTRVSRELQVEVLNDLYTVHSGCQDLLRHLKSQEEAHDFDDVQTMVGDLLLARCPAIVRHWYPPEAVQALDDLGDEPWSDEHIRRALTIMQSDEEKQLDLQRRYSLLKQIRARYCAFIIDEYQDTNPEHARLLSRLWGRREGISDENPSPAGPWDPTICIVGDMKQSIYRFRQAEVTVMRRMVASIRVANSIEQNESRLESFVQEGYGRDPRPVGAGGESGSFIQASDYSRTEQSAPWDYVSFGIDDSGLAIEDIVTRERIEGHIQLRTNFRTASGLLRTLNNMFDDTFDQRHHQFPGDFHATAQPLEAGRETERTGVIEWLLPTQNDTGELPLDLAQGYNLFDARNANLRHLEHELIASRLDALVRGSSTRIWSSDDAAYIEIEPEETISPEDVMILVHSRKHIPDLISRLQSRGLPVMADKQGELLKQPVVQPLMALLELLAKPNSRHAAHSLLRSSIIGASSIQIEEVFQTSEAENYWAHIADYFASEPQGPLLAACARMIQFGAIYEVFDAVLDYSDLLIAFPDESERQVAEMWCALIQKIGSETGHEPSAILEQMKAFATLGNKGPQASSSPTSGAIQIMTIHGAKGLQAPVVIVTGLFEVGRRSSSIEAQNNVLITPDVIAGRIQPWKSKDKPEDALWMLAEQMNKAQNQAELRRQFYVALTRVKDRLIFVGSPNAPCSIDENAMLSMKVNSKGNNMGDLMLDGFRYMGLNSGGEQAWSLEGDELGERLVEYGEQVLQFNPFALYQASGFMPDSLQQLRMYHHPDCFSIQTPTSVLSNWLSIEEQLSESVEVDESDQQHTRQSPTLRMTAHGLDTANSCRRRYWLSHIKGWQSEPLNIGGNIGHISSEEDCKDRSGGEDIESTTIGWPSATSLGSMFHRLVEIGLANPAEMKSEGYDLGSVWLNAQKNRLLSNKEIDNATQSQPEWHRLSHDEQQQTRDRIVELATLLTNGSLGMMVDGDELDGYQIEGLRTEASFFYDYEVNLEGRVRTPLTQLNQSHVTLIDSVKILFEGQADLALAGVHGKHPWLQVVDLKTSGAREEELENHPLYEKLSEPLSFEPQNDAEHQMLRNHRLQLTLYSLVFRRQEEQKPVEQRREVRPPALLIASTGRLVQMPEKMYKEAEKELLTLLDWMANLAADPNGIDEPKRLPMESIDTCKKCPFFKGDVRMCAPQGMELGVNADLSSQ
ncbi:MAG: UvrD-helicase domain-containing protein [Candidatus Poseidoniaceae archaeon]|nr:UvrD-helicase domain-containing protein [Candidatus Poseidoniaceae archaeon]